MTESFSARERPVELDLVQNETLGAYALWAFASAYQGRGARHVALPLAFLVLPLVLHEDTRRMILSTRLESGLAVFTSKLSENREDLFSIHRRAVLLRELTLESALVAVRAGLLRVIWESAQLQPLTAETKPKLPERIKWLEPCATKLGQWFAAMKDEEVTRLLRVDY